MRALPPAERLRRRRERCRAWRKKNKALVDAYRRANKGQINAGRRAWHAKNRDAVLARKRKWRIANREAIRAWDRKWWLAHKREKMDRTNKAKRIAIKDLKTWYVSARLRDGAPGLVIPAALIEAKKEHIRLQRELRTWQR